MGKREEIELPADERHLEQPLPIEWFAVKVSDECVIVNEAGEGSISSYTVESATRNPRVMAQADAILWDGIVGLTSYEDGVVTVSHQFAGIEQRLLVDEFVDGAVPILNRTEMVDLEAA
jgi:hypothetical protein